MERAQARVAVVAPFTLFLILLLLLHLNFRRLTETLIVIATLPFALIGGASLIWLLE